MERLGKHSSRIKELRKRVRDRRQGEVVVDGRRLVADLIRWGIPIRELYVETDAEPDPEALLVAEAAWSVDGKVLDGISPTRHPQGVLAVVAEPSAPPWQAWDGAALYLEGVQDPGNVGAIIRSSAALGAAAVLLSPRCADPFHPAAVRGSAGTVFRLPVEREVSLVAAAHRMRIAGGELWATGIEGTPIDDWRPTQPLLLLLGAEGAGLTGPGLEAAEGTVAIPLDREVDSLNVAVAAGILLHHLRSRGR